MKPRIKIEEIFKNYKNKIYGLALSITRNQTDAEDVVQSVFVKIIDNIKELKNREYLSTWIYKIAYNEALMYLRKRSSRFKLIDGFKDGTKKELSGLFVNWSKMPDEQALDVEFRQRVDNAIKQLPIEYRMPLVLHYVERMPGEAAAAVLKLKEASFRTRLRRAEMMLAAETKDYFKDKLEKNEEENPRCSIWEGFVYNYSRGSLGKTRKKAFDRHIKDCRPCKLFLSKYSKAIKVAKFLECRDLPIELEVKIADFIRKKS
ncbi:MAG: sigma-70 family RNA polymerase sigma factor [Candidatus Omnitrophota bacterium]